MNKPFKSIGLVGIPRKSEALDTHKLLYQWLISQGYQVLVEESLSDYISFEVEQFASLKEIGRKAELAIVIGGDGNVLRTARVLSRYSIRVIGVNRGNLGFLTEINPDTAVSQLSEVLAGHFYEDPRLLIEVSVYDDEGQLRESSFAVNEIVLHPSQVAHMIAYDAYIDDKKAFSQRADGLIVATPTGSTAYSLSAGGPIIAPSVDAFIVLPMFPHSLSVRPLVIKSNHAIRLKFPLIEQNLEISCDSQVMLKVEPSDEVMIKRAKNKFNLIHAQDYDYYRNLSNKLGWLKTLF